MGEFSTDDEAEDEAEAFEGLGGGGGGVAHLRRWRGYNNRYYRYFRYSTLTGTLDTEAEAELGTPGVWDNIARRAWTRDWLFENLYLLLDR